MQAPVALCLKLFPKLSIAPFCTALFYNAVLPICVSWARRASVETHHTRVSVQAVCLGESLPSQAELRSIRACRP